MNTIGPNTMISPDTLSEDIVLSCGKDPVELLQCVAHATDESVPEVESYRGFGCVRFAAFSVVWDGMGTGTLEPLLWELLQCEKIRRIILVGTSGLLAPSTNFLGSAFLITEAYLAGTALDEERIAQPLRPWFRGIGKVGEWPSTTIVSNDFYYGFAGSDRRPGYPLITERMERGFHGAARSAQLTHMETAQFYFFCREFREKGTLDYLAIQGAANPVLEFETQPAHSSKVLTETIRLAIEILRLSDRP